MECHFHSYVVVVLLCLFPSSMFGLSDVRLCADHKCEQVLSRGRTVIHYPAGQTGMLSFRVDQEVIIFSKSAGSDLSLWGAQINGKRGYVNKNHIREDKVWISNPSIVVPVGESAKLDTTVESSLPSLGDMSNTVTLSTEDAEFRRQQVERQPQADIHAASQQIENGFIVDGTTILEENIIKPTQTLPTPQATLSQQPSDSYPEMMEEESSGYDELDNSSASGIFDMTTENLTESSEGDSGGIMTSGSIDSSVPEKTIDDSVMVTPRATVEIPVTPAPAMVNKPPKMVPTPDSSIPADPMDTNPETVPAGPSMAASDTVQPLAPLPLDPKSITMDTTPETVPSETPMAASDTIQSLTPLPVDPKPITTDTTPDTVPAETPMAASDTVQSFTPLPVDSKSIVTDTTSETVPAGTPMAAFDLPSPIDAKPVAMDNSPPTEGVTGESPLPVDFSEPVVPSNELPKMVPDTLMKKSDRPDIPIVSITNNSPNLTPDTANPIVPNVQAILEQVSSQEQTSFVERLSKNHVESMDPLSALGKPMPDNLPMQDGAATVLGDDMYFNRTVADDPVSGQFDDSNEANASDTFETDTSQQLFNEESTSNNILPTAADLSLMDEDDDKLDRSAFVPDNDDDPSRPYADESAIQICVNDKASVFSSWLDGKMCPASPEGDEKGESGDVESAQVRDYFKAMYPEWLNETILVDSGDFATPRIVVIVVAFWCISIIVLYFVKLCASNMSREQYLLTKLGVLDKKLFAITNESLLLKREMETRGSNSSVSVAPSPATLQEISLLKKENERLSGECGRAATVEQERAQLQELYDVSQQEHVEAEKIVQECLEERKNFLQDNDKLIKAIDKLQHQFNDQRLAVGKYEARIKKRDTELKSKIKESRELKAEAANAKLQVDKLTKQIRLLESDMESAESKVVEFEQKMTELNEVKRHLSFAKEALEGKESELEAKTTEFDVLENMLELLKQQKQNERNLTTDGWGCEEDDDPITDIEEISRLKVDLKKATSACESLSEQLISAETGRDEAFHKVGQHAEELKIVRQTRDEAVKEKAELEQKHAVLTTYFNKRETELQKQLGLSAARLGDAEQGSDSSAKKMVSLLEELEAKNTQLSTLKLEMEELERSWKAQNASLEKKQHESWVTVRQESRKNAEAQHEMKTLRSKLTISESKLLEKEVELQTLDEENRNLKHSLSAISNTKMKPDQTYSNGNGIHLFPDSGLPSLDPEVNMSSLPALPSLSPMVPLMDSRPAPLGRRSPPRGATGGRNYSPDYYRPHRSYRDSSPGSRSEKSCHDDSYERRYDRSLRYRRSESRDPSPDRYSSHSDTKRKQGGFKQRDGPKTSSPMV